MYVMNGDENEITLDDINIRHKLRPGDMGYILYMHGNIYKKEYNYGLMFERYVAEGLLEFYQNYNPRKDRVWICEHDDKIIGTIFLIHRENAAQLRYFLLEKEYRGIGLGRLLMKDYMDWIRQQQYPSVYLWTTNEQIAAANLYQKFGFELTEKVSSTDFGKHVIEQKYEFKAKS